MKLIVTEITIVRNRTSIRLWVLHLMFLLLASCAHVQSENKQESIEPLLGQTISYSSYEAFVNDYDRQNREGRAILFLALFNRPIRDSTIPSIYVPDIDTLAKVQEYAYADLEEGLRHCMRFVQYNCCEKILYRGKVMPHLYFVLSQSNDFDSLSKCIRESIR